MMLRVAEKNLFGQMTAVVLARYPLMRDTARLHSLCSDLKLVFPNRTIAIVAANPYVSIPLNDVFCENSTIKADLWVRDLNTLPFNCYVLS